MGFSPPPKLGHLLGQRLPHDPFAREEAWIAAGGPDTFTEWLERWSLSRVTLWLDYGEIEGDRETERRIPTLNPGTR